MARQPRLSLPDQLHHVLLSGNNGQPVFADSADRALFVALLSTHAQAHGVALHAWALMPDHIHLLLTPQRDGALSLCMQAVGRAYVQAFNRRHGRR
ncbi:MAG: transposase, partial [Burkholderiaceae bacterium]|nr:transposase [Burkholderiaceae bacterium]